MIDILKKQFNEGVSYESYLQQSQTKAESTEPVLFQEYYSLNLKRMKRIDKQIPKLNLDAVVKVKLNDYKMLVISEGWCGDAAQIVPFAAYFAKVNDIDLKILYRDENKELMEHFLTNGGMAIPVIITLNKNYEYINHFAPRPKPAQELMSDLKSKGIPKEEINLALQSWYNKDKGKETMEAIKDLYSYI